jgi:outer membrane receptor protein involved in Fe transport
VLGLEGFSEDTQFQFYDDLAFRRRTAPAQFNRTLALDSVSAFGEANVEAHRLLELSLGARYDRFTGDCTPDGLEVPGGACGPLETVASLSPKLGARSQILPWLQLRASYSEGFALPEAQAKFATGAQNLDPNQIAQVELGVRMQAGDAFEADLAAYRIGSTNEFASPAPGEFVNFGETLRSGFEAALRWSPREALDLRAVFALAGSEVEQNLNPSLIGREVTGVPDRTATLTAVWTPLPRLRLNAAYRYVGAYATNAANTVYAPSYDLVDLGASYELDVLPVSARLYLAVDNVADEVHASSFNSLGSIAPGSPRFVRLGLQVGF